MSLTLPIYQLDAFAEAPFTGNPAAVVPLDAWLADEAMQSIALENNLAETAFVAPTPDDPDHDFHIRWFTPTVEVRLCGHATLATAAVLFERTGFEGAAIRFKSKSGLLEVERVEAGRYALNFPAEPPRPAEPPPDLVDILGGVQPTAFLKAVMNMAVLSDEAAVRAVSPDFRALAKVAGDGLIVTAPGDQCHVASRYFAPHAGIDEDPVTGSAHCTVAPYWSQRLGESRLHCRQLSARGGDLTCTVEGDRVRIEGAVQWYLHGEISI
ncbi:MAG: PhzF family phenazine biosynthesis protein [Marivibrio sp.]|uniref:PhzF family phenazine biosynthesis protein n=1 Tax=Marivibrio sp. TaxID=2039719 RepID=UPI0032EF4C6F